MTKLDDKLLPAVKSMATNLGTTVTVVVESLTYTAATGATSRSTTTHASQKLLGVRPVSKEYLESGLAQDGDTQGLFAASGLAFTPAQGDRVTINSKDYTTVRSEDIYSGESIVAYRVQLRAA